MLRGAVSQGMLEVNFTQNSEKHLLPPRLPGKGSKVHSAASALALAVVMVIHLY